jgi:predicted NBD/HSP70 family sugar kinase
LSTDGAPMPGSQTALRKANQLRVVEAVRAAGALTQAEIARATGLSAATVSNIVRELREAEIVAVTPTYSGRRRAQSVSLARKAGMAVGVDFGPSHLRVALGDPGGRILAEEVIAYDVAASAERGVRRAVWLVETLLAQSRVDRSQVDGVGVGFPGRLDARTGEIDAVTFLPKWAGTRLAGELSDQLGMPVQVDNDANLGALGELAEGAGRGCSHLVYLKLSSSVAAGIVADGRLYRGAEGIAGEIGHITVDARGPVCHCGNRGCLETLVGAPYLLQMLPRPNGRDQPLPTLRSVIADALAGDPGCRRILSDAGRAVGGSVAIIANLFNPRLVILGGELARAGDLVLQSIRQATEQGAIPSAVRSLRVVRGELGERAQIVGALALARRLDPLDESRISFIN